MKWKWHSGLVDQYNSNSSLVCQACVFSLIDKDIHLKTYRKSMHFISSRDTKNNIQLYLQITELAKNSSMVRVDHENLTVSSLL